MSRIHEALKRAEQQRTVPLEIPTPSMPEVHSQQVEIPMIPPSAILDPLASPEPLVHSEVEARTRAAEFLRFDDIWTHCANPGWRVDLQRNVFIDPTAPPAVREQFRTLRSRLYQVRDKQPLRSVLVTSSLPGEGKTFVANNLAHALSRQQNCRVLLIDADLRRPDLHAGFGAPISPGLSEYLKGEVSELVIIQRGLPEYLCFIAGGASRTIPRNCSRTGA
jgi:protein-tyrosine kinase